MEFQPDFMICKWQLEGTTVEIEEGDDHAEGREVRVQDDTTMDTVSLSWNVARDLAKIILAYEAQRKATDEDD